MTVSILIDRDELRHLTTAAHPTHDCEVCSKWNKIATQKPSAFESWRGLLGKQVEITLAREPDVKKVRGQLVEFAEDGEVDYKDEMGVVHYCWPCLDIEEIK